MVTVPSRPVDGDAGVPLRVREAEDPAGHAGLARLPDAVAVDVLELDELERAEAVGDVEDHERRGLDRRARGAEKKSTVAL